MHKFETLTGQEHKSKHPRGSWAYLIAGIPVILILIYVYQNNSSVVALSKPGIQFDEDKTRQYVADFDPFRYENLGSDYDNPIYSPESQGMSLDQIDNIYDYDFQRLAKTEASLEGVDRPRALKHIFDTVTEGAVNGKEKQMAILRFLHKSGYHNSIWQPMYPDKIMVMDPLVLLELHEMRCGHVARLAVDLFHAAGYEGRIVQLGGHIIAEIFYEGDWHYFDADIFGGGETVLDARGDIPSVAELINTDHGYPLDALAPYHESISTPTMRSWPYPSFYYFSKAAYSGYLPSYQVKTATNEQTSNHLYGWNYYEETTANDIELSETPGYYMPGAVAFTSIQTNLEQALASIEWSRSEDADHDLLGYKVFVSNVSRGWDYLEFNGEEGLLSFWGTAGSKGWDPQMYSNLFELPPHEVALIETRQTSVQFPIKNGITYYVTVMPYDAHGENVGKNLYFMSNEIKLSAGQ
jgi:hypothetical protein